MKAPFFLLGFLSMLIAVSAFARVIEEQVPYEQIAKNVVPGMVFAFPKDFRFEHDGYNSALVKLTNLDHTDSCTLAISAQHHVRLSEQLEWKVERSFTNTRHQHQIELVASVEGSRRQITMVCRNGETSLEILRNYKIKVPSTRPSRVELIRDEAPAYEHVRDENATIAI